MLNKIACLFSGRIPLNSSFLLTFYTNNKYPVYCPMPDPTKSYRLSFALCRERCRGSLGEEKSRRWTQETVQNAASEIKVFTCTALCSEKFLRGDISETLFRRYNTGSLRYNIFI